MNENRSTIMAVLLCIIFYLGYTKYLETKYPQLKQKRESAATPNPEDQTTAEKKVSAPATPAPSVPTPAQASPKVDIKLLSADELTLKNDKLQILFDQKTSAIQSILTNDYYTSKEPPHTLVELVDTPIMIQGSANADLDLHQGYFARRDGSSLTFWRDDQSGLRISQTFTLAKTGYELSIATTFTNTSGQPVDLKSHVLINEAIYSIDAGGFLFPSAMYDPRHWSAMITDIGGDTERFPTQKFCDPGDESTEPMMVDERKNENVKFIGLESRYFLRVIMPETKKLSYSYERLANTKSTGCQLRMIASLDQGTVAPGQIADITAKAYFGPKDVAILTSVSNELTHAVNLGWFSAIAYPLLSLLNLFYALLHNYGLAIIVVTIILKMIFYPLTKQAAISAQKMKKLQPEMKKIQEKYKEDRPRMQMELMNLYKVNKVNPAKSCLPILPTIPVFIAFYNVLMYAFELRQAPFAFWIHDLSAKDPYYVSPLLLGAFMLLQMKLTPNVGMDKTQQRIMMFMPIVFTFAMISLPSGLVLYMLVNSILTILQQQWLNKKLAHI